MNETNLSQLKGTLKTPDSPGLWSPRIAADYAGFQSPVTVLRAFRAGKLPGYKINARVVRFEPSDVKTWIAAGRVGSNATGNGGGK